MKILLIHQQFLADGQPGGTRFNDFARTWSTRGHDVRVIASSVPYDSGQRVAMRGLWRGDADDDVDVRRVWTPAHPRGTRRQRFASMLGFGVTASVTSTMFVRWRPDVVLASSPALTAAIPGLFAASWYRTPFVFEVRDLWPESAVTTGAISPDSPAVHAAHALEATACELADRVVGVTPAILDDLVERGLVERERTVMIPNGVDVARIAPVNRASVRREQGWGDRFVAIYAGAHGIANALDQLVEAARILRYRSDIVLVAVGRGPERDRLRRASRDLPNLQWLDAVSPERAHELVGAANAALVLLQDNPTFQTVYPNKMFAAMAAEVPVILAVDGVARELILRNHAGVFVPPENAEQLAATIRHLAADPALCLNLGWSGRELVEAQFDRRVHAQRYLELLDEVSSSSN